MLDPEVIRITYDYPTSTATPMPIIFTYDKPEEVKMIKTDADDVNTELVQGTDYTVDEDEDNCYLLELDADGATVTVYRDTTVDQQRDFVEEGKYRIAEIEAAMDKITMQNQEQADGITRSIRTSLNTPTNFDAVLPSPNAGKAILFNDTGLGLTVSTINFNETVAAAQAIATAAAASAAAALASQTAAAASQSSASSSATAAAASAAAAALSVANAGLPNIVGKALNFIRVKADETGYEARTAIQVASDIIDRCVAMQGTCSTASGTADKVVTLPNFELKEGALISVLFSNANTAATPTLNVNATGAKGIYNTKGIQYTTGNTFDNVANEMCIFMYDGTRFILINARFLMSRMSMPSSTSVSGIFPGSIGTTAVTYVAPADGYISVVNTSATNVTLVAGVATIALYIGTGGGGCGFWGVLPIKKGATASVKTESGSVTLASTLFTYTEGSV